MIKDGVNDIQRDHLERVIRWAGRIRDHLSHIERHLDLPVWFRPSSTGVAVIGLTPQAPQRGRSGFRNVARLERDLQRIFERHCTGVAQDRPTPEKQLQSFLILGALRAHRRLVPLEEAARRGGAPVDLFFMVDEISLPLAAGRIVCDLLAVRAVSGGYVPAVIELKSARQKQRLIRQVTDYATYVDRHADLFERLFEAVSPFPIRLIGPCEKWIVWPHAGLERDPQADDLAARGIRTVGYAEDGSRFRFIDGARDDRARGATA